MNPTPRANLVWFVLLATFWAFYGLLGRDAWKGEEALALAPILDWLNGSLSAWTTPAPLYTFLAGLLAKLTAGHVDAQNGARLASGVFTVIALLFTGLTARSLFGAGFGTAATLSLMGGLGLMLRAHALLPETALLAAWSVLLYGISAGRAHVRQGGLAIGLALAALTLGLRGLPDLVAGLLVVLLPLFSTNWCSREYRRAASFGIALAGGLAIAGLGLFWAHDLLSGWLAWHGPGRYLPMRVTGGAYGELPWFAWPLWPLAAWAIWHAHRRLPRTPELHPPLVALAVLLLVVLFPAWSRDGALLPVLLPLALLAAFAVEHLRRGAAQAFYWFGVLCFLFFVLAFWVYFSAIEWGTPARLAARMARLTPGYHAGAVDTGAVLLAGAATLVWLMAIPLFPRAKSRPVLVWATGMGLSWILIAALFLPWAEAGWGYRPLITSMARHLPRGACLNTRVDAPMAVMLRYHLDPPSRPGCPWTLRLVTRKSNRAVEGSDAILLWEGYRPRYKSLIYRLERHAQD
jgi:hypothetical protein